MTAVEIVYAESFGGREAFVWRVGQVIEEGRASERAQLHRDLASLVATGASRRLPTGRTVWNRDRLLLEVDIGPQGSGPAGTDSGRAEADDRPSGRVKVTIVTRVADRDRQWVPAAAEQVVEILGQEGLTVDVRRLIQAFHGGLDHRRPFSGGGPVLAAIGCVVFMMIWALRRLLRRKGR
ncbi:hypothetical protein O7608_02340 [Solwaraspora sp. WMMA2056]|uniref:hypothetical protein n=1 Tax=Solwaraspora sp. WMMA2056 TaxID=3015161 RepID=UPI00259B0781|nr:hypothetical protein [Solwaraspora sp. WMMA2056]WJK41300.1 hypothetical protein O7608_02340 [Solwaraspora sp. WMMA2056]